MQINYWMPTKILMDRQVVLKNKDEFAKYGMRALIVTGKNSAKVTGALGDVESVLKEKGMGCEIFDQIEQNPCIETIEKAGIIGRKMKADFVIGIGGGSPLDAAKAIGVMIKHEELTAKTLFTDKKLQSIPILAVPTTAGTGSETTPYSILTDHEAKTKRNLGQTVFCSAAFLDAAYTEFMPMDVTVHTALDTMTHLVESYLNTNSTTFSDLLVKEGLALWGECLQQLLSGSYTYAMREKLLLSSSIAGMAIAQTGTSLPHGMGYPLTYYKNVPHGLANAVLFKAYLRRFKDKKRIEEIFSLLGFDGQRAFEEMLSKLVSLSISATKGELEVWSQEMCSNTAKLKNHPEPITYKGILEIYMKSLI